MATSDESDTDECAGPRDGTLPVYFSGRNYRNAGNGVNRRALSLLVLLAPVLLGASGFFLPGCSKPAKAPEPSENRALKDLEQKLRPTETVKAPPPLDKEALLRDALAMVAAWVKDIDNERADAALKSLVTEEELGGVAMPGVRDILAASLLPQNQKTLESILSSAQGKEAVLGRWTPGELGVTDAPDHYRKSVPMISESTLEVSIAGLTHSFRLDLLSIDGRWKIFRLSSRGT